MRRRAAGTLTILSRASESGASSGGREPAEDRAWEGQPSLGRLKRVYLIAATGMSEHLSSEQCSVASATPFQYYTNFLFKKAEWRR